MSKNLIDIQIFNHPQMGRIRAVDHDYQPWFCLNDICKALELHPRGVRQRLTETQIASFPVPDSIGRLQLTTFVNEAGLYNIILDSRKKEAKEFRNWVVGEVLPSIRKHGAYVHATASDTPETIQAKADKAAQMAVEKMKKQLEAKNRELAAQDLQLAEKDLIITQTQDQVALLEEQNKASQSNVNYALALLASNDAITMNEMAKLLTQAGFPTGQNRLFQWMREHHYLCSRPCFYNLPTQEYMDQGLFRIREYVGYNLCGTIIINHTTEITPKGQKYFINQFRHSREIDNQLNLENLKNER